MLKDILEIVLVTYNRVEKLKKTFEQLLDSSSPVRDLSITVLNNNSTDGTSEFLDELSQKYKNIIHIKRNRNVGANANIAAAYEIAKKTYLWVLCDDDNYDFSNFQAVENAINFAGVGRDMIMVSKYALKKKVTEIDLLYQATFVPSMIIKTNIITNTVMRNIYDNIYTMYTQIVPVVAALNDGKEIYVIEGNAIVQNGDNYGKSLETNKSCDNYIRGANKDGLYYRNSTMSQFVGFINAIELLKNEKLKENCLEETYDVVVKLFHPFSKVFMHFSDIWVNYSKKQKIHFIFKYIINNSLKKIFYIKRGKRGIYIELFGKLKTKIFPLKEKQI